MCTRAERLTCRCYSLGSGVLRLRQKRCLWPWENESATQTLETRVTLTQLLFTGVFVCVCVNTRGSARQTLLLTTPFFNGCLMTYLPHLPTSLSLYCVCPRLFIMIFFHFIFHLHLLLAVLLFTPTHTFLPYFCPHPSPLSPPLSLPFFFLSLYPPVPFFCGTV